MRFKNLILVAGIVFTVLAVSYFRSVGRSDHSDAMAVAQCVRLYAEATTAAESSLVDGTHPIQGPTDETTCLSLRVEGRLDR